MPKVPLWLLVCLVTLAILLAGCGTDPRNEAEAFQMRTQAEQDALDRALSRAQVEQLQPVQIEERKNTIREWYAGLNRLIKYGSIFGSISISIAFLSLAGAASYASIQFARAAARRADIGANLVKLDPSTRQYPLLMQHVHGSRYALHNANTGSVTMLDTDNPADRQLIATAGGAQISGVIAQEAARSVDPAGVSIIQPPIILEKQ